MQLLPHPDADPGPVRRLDASASRGSDGGLVFHWELAADLDALRLPAPASSRRVDGLWKHSCFEAFIGRPDEEAYLELNIAPSGEWALYRFEACRIGMAPQPLAAPPDVRCTRRPQGLGLAASLPPLAATDGRLCIALCAVIETRSGTMSHWALRHPPGAPDFHHAAARVLELGPARPAD